MPEDPAQVYVLRLLRDDSVAAGWRISLYRASSGQRLHFTSPTALLRHLGQLLQPAPPPPTGPRPRPQEEQ